MDLLGQNRQAGRERAGQPPRRIIAGNTGAGVYKDWPSGHEGTIVDVTRVAEMRVLERSQVGSIWVHGCTIRIRSYGIRCVRGRKYAVTLEARHVRLNKIST